MQKPPGTTVTACCTWGCCGCAPVCACCLMQQCTNHLHVVNLETQYSQADHSLSAPPLLLLTPLVSTLRCCPYLRASIAPNLSSCAEDCIIIDGLHPLTPRMCTESSISPCRTDWHHPLQVQPSAGGLPATVACVLPFVCAVSASGSPGQHDDPFGHDVLHIDFQE